MKKLIPALAMLLISAMLLGTSTFAWFALSDSATASGMTVQANTHSALSITKTSGKDYTNSVTLDTTKNSTNLEPVAAAAVKSTGTVAMGASETGVNSVKFYALNGDNKATNPNSSAATTSLSAAITADTLSANFKDDTTNFAKDTVYLLFNDGTTTGTASVSVEISISYTGTAIENIYKALHIGFLDEDKNFTNVDVGTGFTATDGENEITKKISLLTLTSGDEETLVLYVWYEGEDTDCMTKNCATQGLDISLDFSASVS